MEDVAQWIVDNVELFCSLLGTALVAVSNVILYFCKTGKKKVKKIINDNPIDNTDLSKFYIEIDGEQKKLSDLNIKRSKE